MKGYLHPEYVSSLAEFGDPYTLPLSGGWLLKRHIPGLGNSDLMGPYPLFFCHNWQKLHLDIDSIEANLISLALVTDPFGAYDEPYLQRCFKDVILPFKSHFIIKLNASKFHHVSKHHRYYAKKALKNVTITILQSPIQSSLDGWLRLYTVLKKRHRLHGIKAFSKDSFSQQLSIPGVIMFQACYQDELIGAHLWFQHEEVAYSHLAAYSPLGYEMMASYALHWQAIDYFADKVRWLDLGAGAGICRKTSTTDGLNFFKQGWSTETRIAYFCGRIFNPIKYYELVQACGNRSTSYFPAYRAGEFV
ncbi:hypothetical protein CSB45_06365 [candidate division KSB3 bacterium]|uniref:BioF2-like acetyltransferase domain-containing protein n=1 Tax=candidate division KSB3 bacterium TaxID=2044937 RepID=A0A2G6E7U4_9BACT|nr:MAG: hypothetical protein CSB45_06365 [candidate division KSB3 bacterium]PIE30267.1 MAG: hypothetical protein CSA57_05080 [candidate division KSB3 bacterium]